MKYLILSIGIAFLSCSAFSQSAFSVVSEVSKDSIRVKWFADNFDNLQKLIHNGATIERVSSDGMQKPESLDFSGAVKFEIRPCKERFAKFSATNPEFDKIEGLLNPFMENAAINQEGKEFAFALLTLENSVSPTLGKLIGSEYAEKKPTGAKYLVYKIQITGVPVQFIQVDASKQTEYPKIAIHELKLDQKSRVSLSFQAKQYLPFGFGFHFERSLSDTLHPVRLTKTPYVRGISQDAKQDAPDFFRDENYQEGVAYYYRIAGLNYFGTAKMYSEWVRLDIPTFIHGVVYIDTVFAEGNKRVVTGSYLQDPENKSPHPIDKYLLLRSETNRGKYIPVQEKISHDSTVTFEVIEERTGDHAYYRIAALIENQDTVFSSSRYVFTLDQEPPAPPSKVTGKIDSLGIVTLNWNAPLDKDIQGYRVFRANASFEEFNERTKRLSMNTFFTDTLALDNLTSEVYYFVTAIDLNYNNSISSDTVLLIKPDTIAPVPGLISKIEMKDSALLIQWINSTSKDAFKNVLIRQSAAGTDSILTWNQNSKLSFADTELLPGTKYAYTIVTLDKSGNKASSQVYSQVFEPGYRAELKTVQVKTDEKRKGIQVSWEKPQEKVFAYYIYRKQNDGSFTLIKTLEGDQTTYLDKNLSIDNKYFYYVQYMTSKGILSKPSKVQEITY